MGLALEAGKEIRPINDPHQENIFHSKMNRRKRLINIRYIKFAFDFY